MATDRRFPGDEHEALWRCPKCRYKKRAVTEPQCPDHPYDAMAEE